MKISVKPNESVLARVEKPGRYTGGEWNESLKPANDADIRFALCFPDVYEVGMSHLGIKILYHLLNERSDTCCERAFAPWVDMEQIMREENIPLGTLESGDDLKDFDIVGFTLQYEMSYTNVLNMLDLAGIPLRADERLNLNNIPFVCCGGPCTVNPEPIAEFVDFFVIGEAEEVINEITDLFAKRKKAPRSKESLLQELAQLEGVYVPGFYKTSYRPDGTIDSFTAKESVPLVIKKRIIRNLDEAYYPEKMIVPFLDVVHDRITLELFRGCKRGCRFCQAGYIYRPVRERSPEKLVELAKKLIDSTGYEELGLVSLSTGDYSHINELIEKLLDVTEKKKVSFSLPSLRLDSFSPELAEKAKKIRKSGLTFAPEAGTRRLRNAINKGVTEEDLHKSCKIAFEGGWSTIKLYYMIGLPTETPEDVDGIAEMARGVTDLWNKHKNPDQRKRLTLNISTSMFVPKPFTPFQWEAQDRPEVIKEKQNRLKDLFKFNKYVSYKYHDSLTGRIEGILARGDRRLADIIEAVWKKGGKFESWDEFFDYGRWAEAFEERNMDMDFYVNRKREFTEILPWSFIDVGIPKGLPEREAKRCRNISE